MDTDLLGLVDPGLRVSALQIKAAMDRFGPMSDEKLVMWRALNDSVIRPPLEDIAVTEQRVATAGGASDVAVYVINARPGRACPGILHMHGGGFYAGSARVSLRDMQETALALDCTIVSVDYRIAPETRYHGSLEDNYSSLCWMYDHAEEIGVDRERIAVTGESAGGGHAVLLSIAARDRGGPSIQFQMLTYPMLDDRTGIVRPVPAHIGAFGWSVDANRFGWSCFLGQEPGGNDVPTEAVPARIENLAGLPPTFIGVGGLDFFVGENLEFARRLIASGVPTELLIVPGAFHGFDTVVREADISKRFEAAKRDALRRAFDRSSL